MQMNDSQRIPASREKVWAALNDPEVLKQCIPGCQSLEASGPNEMTATVVFKVGPVKATFGGKVTLSDLEDRKSTRLNSSHQIISYAVFCLKKKKNRSGRVLRPLCVRV